MWGTNTRKKTIINVLLFLLIVGIAAAILYGAILFREKTQGQDEELAQLQNQQKEEQAVARQEAKTAIDREYARQMQVAADYMPGIVFWGDALSAGYDTNLNYPYVVQCYVDTYISGVYDFSSTISNAIDYAWLDWSEYTMGIPVVNMGTGKESSETVLARAGVIPMVLGRSITTGGDPVPISIQTEEGKELTPLTTGDLQFNPVTIGGVEGTISLDTKSYADNRYTYYSFEPKDSLQEIELEAGSRIIPASADLYRDYIHVISIGMFDASYTPEELVSKVKTILARQTQNTDRFIVLGPYESDYVPIAVLDQVDSSMMEAFGSRYISVRKYLTGDGFATIKPKDNDEYYISLELVPPSFKVTKTSQDLNSNAHRLVGKLIYSRMSGLGFFDEIRQELGITDSEKEILLESPELLEDVIANQLN